MINRKFINFKTYNGFLAKKNEIPEDSIVFIQDKPCIWARGKEYICDGPSTASVERNTLTFKNGNDKMIFKFQQKDGTITIEDSEGNKSSATYVLEENFLQEITNLTTAITNINQNADDYVVKSLLATVAFTGEYSNLKHKPGPIVIDSQLNASSENPVQNKVIYNELNSKANKSSLDSYVLNSTYTNDKDTILQEKLYEGDGIDIYRESGTNKLKIKSTLDTNVYLIVDNIESVIDPNPNKIYLVEAMNQNGTYRYEQWRYRNGQWISFDAVMPTIDLSGYKEKDEADAEHNYLLSLINDIDLTPYAKIEEDINPILEALDDFALKEDVDDSFAEIYDDYATKEWVETYFVKKLQVYTPRQGDWGSNESSEGSSEGSSGNGDTIIIYNPVIDYAIDSELDSRSSNAVENRAITRLIDNLKAQNRLRAYEINELSSSLSSKVDSSELDNYVSDDELNTALDDKQDVLIPGNGISIINNVISSTLDTSVYVFVSELPSTNINDDKIYIVETINGNERTYMQWKHENGDWVQIGSVTPEVDLTDYITASLIASIYETLSHAASTYQPKRNDYALTSDVLDVKDYADETFLEKGDYADNNDIESLRIYADNKFLLKGGYALASDVSTALTTLLGIIDQKYVLKLDVYNPNNPNGWSSSDPTQISIGSGSGSSELGSGSSGSNMVTCTVLLYEDWARLDMVDQNTYYFTYEPGGEEPETSNWGFGDQFPIILTDGSTPDSIGTFPINLV